MKILRSRLQTGIALLRELLSLATSSTSLFNPIWRSGEHHSPLVEMSDDQGSSAF